jgi:hypothetical protein
MAAPPHRLQTVKSFPEFLSKAATLAMIAILITACGPSMGDELGPLAADETECHVLPEAVNARFPEVAKTFALQLHDDSRTLTIGVDSANRVRVFTASVQVKRGTTRTVRMSGVKLESDGRMGLSSRTVTTGDFDLKAVSSNVMPLLPADTTRVRALAGEALKRCVK